MTEPMDLSAPPTLPDSATAAAPALSYELPDFTPLDPRHFKLSQISEVIGYLVLMAVVGTPTLLFARGRIALLILGGILTLITLASAISFFYYNRLAYRAWGYRIDDKVLAIRFGVWWRTVKLVPLNRLQHADLKVGPIQRRFGLATLVVHTAGTHASEIEIPGLSIEEATRLRDHLVAVGGDDGV